MEVNKTLVKQERKKKRKRKEIKMEIKASTMKTKMFVIRRKTTMKTKKRKMRMCLGFPM